MGEVRNAYEILVGNLKTIAHLVQYQNDMG